MSAIEWTDKTWNPVTGCDKVSPGCAHCYAEVMAARLEAMGQKAYANGFKLTLQPDALKRPLSWRKPAMVFVNSMSDLFHDDVPESYIWQVWAVMAACPQHRFQVLTKRAERMQAILGAPDAEKKFYRAVAEFHDAHFHDLDIDPLLALVDPAGWPLPNVWVGVSVENHRFEHRLTCLAGTPAAVRFASFEPLLGPLEPNLRGIGLDWGIIGGESGHGARPMESDWVRGLIRSLDDAGAAVFVKQLGSVLSARLGISGKGGDPTLWPPRLDDLKRREWPASQRAAQV